MNGPPEEAVKRLHVFHRLIDVSTQGDTLAMTSRLLSEIGSTWDHYAWLARLDGRADVAAEREYAAKFLLELARMFTYAERRLTDLD
jgi:hypothetical protein